MNGDPSFGKLVVGYGNGSADIFVGEVAPNGVIKNALNAGSGVQNSGDGISAANPSGVSKSTFGANGSGAGSSGDGNLLGKAGADVASNGSAASPSALGSGSPDSFGLDPSVHGLGDGLSSGSNPSHSKKASTLPHAFSNNSSPSNLPGAGSEPRDPASVPPTGDAAPENTPAVASRDRGVTGEPRQGVTPTKPEKPPEAFNPFTDNGADSLGDAIRGAVPSTDVGNALGDAAAGAGLGNAQIPRREEPPREGPKPEPPDRTRPDTRPPGDQVEQLSAFEQLSRVVGNPKAKIDESLFRRAIEEAGTFKGKKKEAAQQVISNALETSNRKGLIKTMQDVKTPGGQEVAQVAADLALTRETCPPEKGDVPEGSKQ